jgi:hypothetical protein
VRRLVAVACVVAGVLPISAFGESAPDLIYPAPVRTFQAEGGYRSHVHGDVDDESFYRVSYDGQLIDSKGEPFTSLEHVDLAVPASIHDAGDRRDIELTLTNRSGEVGGELFEGQGARPLALRGLGAANLRGAAYVATDLDGDKFKVALGVETKPFRVPGASKLGAANYLIFGLMGERNEQADAAASDESYTVATGRLFIGKALGMHARPDADLLAKKIAAEFLEKAPTREDAVALASRIQKIPAEKRSKMQAWLLSLLEITDASTDWNAAVFDFTAGISEAVSEQPTASVYLEASGWYADASDQPKHRGLATLTVDYWPLPTRDDVILRASYEWGFERLQPNIRVNQVTVSAVIQF